MDQGQTPAAIDMIRWTFTPQAEKSAEIAAYLREQSLEVQVGEGNELQVTWDEPDSDDIDTIVNEIWALNGADCEITHEEFQRTSLLVLSADEGADAAAA